ncbi:MAG TPA: aminotransferase class V-fold PLP-dependent enzyme [Vicinamibacterales bacterium]|jgi:selenocysteine lyase/cysteine desulfurase
MPTLSIEQFRSRFPIFKSRVYVNSCSQGALSTDVEAAMHEYLATWHEQGSPWELWVEQVEALRTAFARSIGADRDEIAVMPSASAGINAVASALDFTGPRSTVVMGEFEFPTMAQVWLAQQRRGATVRWAKATGDRLEVDAYADVIDERTLIVPMTHVCYKNGHKTDIASVARLARERGAYSFLDDYQRTGSGPIDVHALGVDFMVTGCLKYILAAAGVAFLYVRRDIVERFEPTITGWFGRVNPFAFQIHSLDWPPAASRFESGTPPVPSAYAALASLRLLESVGIDAVGRRVAQLVERYRSSAEASGFVVRTPSQSERRGPLVVVQSVDAPALVARLAGRGIIGSSRGNGLRISFHAYNNEADVDTVLEAIRAEAPLLERVEAKSV